MRRGTTPTLIFTTPYAAELVVSGTIMFSQRGIVCLRKEIGNEAVEVDDYVIKVYLTREETLSFTEADKKIKMQLDLELKSGKHAVSNVLVDRLGEYIGVV